MNKYQRNFLHGDTRAERSTDKTETILSQAFQYHRSGDLEEARQRYQSILAFDPTHSDALHLLGVVSHQMGDNSAAASFIQQSIRSNSNNSDAHSNLGNVLMALGKIEEAESAYREALRVDPKNSAAYFNLANILSSTDRGEAAIALYDMAIRHRPDYSDAYFNRSAALFRLGQFDQATAGYEKVLELDPHRESAHSNLGSSYAGQKRWNEAREALLIAVKRDENNALAHSNLGLVLTHLGDHDQAVSHLRKAVALAPENIEIHFGLARSLMATDLAKALTVAERTVLRPDARGRDWYILGAVQTSLRMSRQALESFERAQRLDPASVFLSGHFGLAHLQERNTDAAIAFFEQLRLENPDFSLTAEEIRLVVGDVVESVPQDLEALIGWVTGQKAPAPKARKKKNGSRPKAVKAAA